MTRVERVDVADHVYHVINRAEEALEHSITKSVPFGKESWVHATVKRFGIEQVLTGVGRPRNSG